MEILRVKNPKEFFEVAERLKELFRIYLERTKIEVPLEIMFKNYINYTIYPDYYLFIFKNNNEIIGFIGANLLHNSNYNILYIIDVYVPKMGQQLKVFMKDVMNILGINEIWGEAKENVYRAYRLGLGGQGLKKVQFVRLVL